MCACVGASRLLPLASPPCLLPLATNAEAIVLSLARRFLLSIYKLGSCFGSIVPAVKASYTSSVRPHTLRANMI